MRVRDPEGLGRAREESWGLRDYNERGELVGLEIWAASERLPWEILEALPRLEGESTVIERQPGALAPPPPTPGLGKPETRGGSGKLRPG